MMVVMIVIVVVVVLGRTRIGMSRCLAYGLKQLGHQQRLGDCALLVDTVIDYSTRHPVNAILVREVRKLDGLNHVGSDQLALDGKPVR